MFFIGANYLCVLALWYATGRCRYLFIFVFYTVSKQNVQIVFAAN